MDRIAIRLLRVSIVVLLLGSVLGQLLVPVAAVGAAEAFPEVGYLVIPYSAVGILVIACGQVALLVVWRTLSMISGGASSPCAPCAGSMPSPPAARSPRS